MTRRIPSTLATLVVVATLAAGACSDNKNDDAASTTTSAQAATNKTVTKTIEITFDGPVDDPNDRVFAVTYFYSAELGPKELGETLTAVFGEGKQAPASVVMAVAGVCGPNGYAAMVGEATGFKVEPVTEKPCTDDAAPFSVELDVPVGATLQYSVDSALVSDLENAETFAGNYVGDPSDPPTAEDFEVVKADDTKSYTYRFGPKS
jgi:hypothetical protein